MNRKELVEKVAKNLKMQKNEVDRMITTTLDVMKTEVKKGNDISLVGFGSFTKMKRAARTGMNPSTGEKIQIKAKNVVKFRPGKAFTESLNPNRK